MTNLSDLFPAGAGKQVRFTASGNVTSSGKPVVLNSDGTVSEVSGTAAVVGSQTQVIAQTMQAYPTVCSTSGSQAFAGINDDNSGGTHTGEGFVLTIASSAVTVSSSSYQYATGRPFHQCCAYDTTNDKVIMVWHEGLTNPFTLKVRIGTISGTGASASISWGATTDVKTSTTYFGEVNVAFDPDTNNFVIVYNTGSSQYTYAWVGTVSGTGVVMGSSEVTVNSSYGVYANIVYDTDTDRMVIAYAYSGLHARVCTVSGSSSTATLTVGAQTTLSGPTTSNDIKMTYDTSADKVLIVFENGSNDLVATVGTVTGGGTNTISLGTATTLLDYSVVGIGPTNDSLGATFDSNQNKSVIVYRNQANGYGYMTDVSISGTTPSAGENTVVLAVDAGTYGTALAYNATEQESVYLSTDSNGYQSVRMIAPLSTNLTSTNFLGISNAAISSAASGNITMKGGIASTGLSSLTPASDYYVQADGSISTTFTAPVVKIGKALSATAINLEYTS